MRIEWDREGSAVRRRVLRDYYARHVLRGDCFVCGQRGECRASYAGRFVPAQLNAPGACYDLTADGVPLRIVIIGQETGTLHAHIAVAQRLQNMHRAAHEQRYRADGVHKARSQHIKGVTSALRLLFGKGLGEAYDDEFVHFADGTQRHLFDCFALVNYLLCSAVSTTRSKRGESTATMRRNCNRHFRATLEILEPTVLVAQGKSFWPSVRRTFDAVDPLAEHLYRVHVGDCRALLASFTHPSAMHPHNWGSNTQMPYLRETVAPTLARLQEYLFAGGG
jgi:hypothetical protein